MFCNRRMISEDNELKKKNGVLAVAGVPAEKKHKKIIYKYIDLHMPVTRKRAGGADTSTFDGFSTSNQRVTLSTSINLGSDRIFATTKRKRSNALRLEKKRKRNNALVVVRTKRKRIEAKRTAKSNGQSGRFAARLDERAQRQEKLRNVRREKPTKKI